MARKLLLLFGFLNLGFLYGQDCGQPTFTSFTNITETSVTVNWDNPDSRPDFNLSIQPIFYWDTTNSFAIDNGATSYTINGLYPGTTYYATVIVDGCAPPYQTANSPVESFTTLALPVSCDIPDQCLYTFRLGESFGDGWNGNWMSVVQNGQPVAILDWQNASGPSCCYRTQQVPLCDSQPFELYWAISGKFPHEISISVVNPMGQTIYDKPFDTGSQGTTLFTGNADCNGLATVLSIAKQWQISPNPASDVVLINAPNTQLIDSVGLFNLLGKQLLNKSINAAEASIDVSGLAKGIYLLEIVSGSTTEMSKIIVD